MTTQNFLLRRLRFFTGRPRLWSSVLLGVLVYLLLPPHAGAAPTRVLLAWNSGALTYLVLATLMLRRSDTAAMQRRARREGEGRLGMLLVVVGAAIAVLLAVASQLASLKDLHGAARIPHVVLAALTVLSSWLFTQTLMALNYAHDFYRARDHGQDDPLTFPGTQQPGYADFFYFSCVIGTSGQTADVTFNGPSLRPLGTLHCVMAFFFNTTVLAFTVNIAASLF